MQNTPWLCLLLLSVALSAAGECPPDFVHLGDECYMFGQEPMTKDEASDYCVSLGGQLASLQTCSLFTHVSRYLEVDEIPTSGKDYWVGVSRASDEWAWTDSGNALPYGAPYWDPFHPVQSEADNCAVLPHSGGYLRPLECDVQHLPICERALLRKEAPPPPPPRAGEEAPRTDCRAPFEPLGGRCLHFNDEFLAWDAARVRCSELAGDYAADLAVLGDCDLFAAVARLLEEKQDASGLADWVWVGAHDARGEEGRFRWLDGDFADEGVPFWCPGQPNGFEGRQHCVMLWGANAFYGADEDCSTIHRSLCEMGL